MSTADLRDNLHKALGLTQESIEFLCILFDIIQVFDDIVDEESVKRSDINFLIWNTLVGIHSNKFFKDNAEFLIPVMATAIIKWQASDISERRGAVDEKSFMWRASFYDVVAAVAIIVHGPAISGELSELIMRLYGENFQEYASEFIDRGAENA